MKKQLLFIACLLFLFPIGLFAQSIHEKLPPPLKVGVSIGIKNISAQKMAYAKSVGISCVNISLNPLVDNKGNINMSDRAIKKLVKEVKKNTKAAGITISAFHMPFGRYVDLSFINEKKRKKVVRTDKKLLQMCAPLHPDIVLFHPSWYLSVGQREQHISQMILSAVELNQTVKSIGAVMVIENMTGPELYVQRKGVKYERPLFRTVEETMKIMNRLPPDICGAVDMNHILHPEKLVLALGHRLKFVHIADGDGAHERHYFPCSGKGMNDWIAIIDALYKAGYTGPFMYECHYKDLRDLAPCYNFMYNKYLLKTFIKPEYAK